MTDKLQNQQVWDLEQKFKECAQEIQQIIILKERKK